MLLLFTNTHRVSVTVQIKWYELRDFLPRGFKPRIKRSVNSPVVWHFQHWFPSSRSAVILI